jgi:hypothetical protein
MSKPQEYDCGLIFYSPCWMQEFKMHMNVYTEWFTMLYSLNHSEFTDGTKFHHYTFIHKSTNAWISTEI